MAQILRNDDSLLALRDSAVKDLTDNILPFWQTHAFNNEGWLTGAVLNELDVDDDRPRHSVLVARILWTFASAALAFPEQRDSYIETGETAFKLLTTKFWDHENGGVFWSLAPNGEVDADRKQIYAQAFTIYALAQWHEATGSAEAIERALELFDALELHARERVHGGYLEALSREWGPLENTALSDKDLSVPKSMNTNLHVLEAYTTLLRVTGNKVVQEALQSLQRVSLDHIVRHEPWAYSALFFDLEWNSQVDTISYGHDIEASWLLWDAWEALQESGVEDPRLEEDTRVAVLALADEVRERAVDADGGVMYEGSPAGVADAHKHWWPQAEGVVGWINAYQVSGREADRQTALKVWEFIDRYVIDHKHGEWFAELDRDGQVFETPNTVKIGPWKCPYHNSRMSFELLKRIG